MAQRNSEALHNEAENIVKTKWVASWQNQQCGSAPSEDSDQPGYPPSLIRVFAVRMKKACVLSYPFSAQQRLWSDWADAQADLSFRWAQLFCWLCHEAAQITNWASSWENLSFAICDNNCTYHPVHPRSLISLSAFVVCCLDTLISILTTCMSKFSNLYLADWFESYQSQIPEDTFSCDVSHIYYTDEYWIVLWVPLFPT